MKKGLIERLFVCFLCLSFLSLMNGLPVMAAETKNLPIGEMVSKGDVKHEASKNVWQTVTSSSFPVFPGTKVRTEQGVATIRLSNNGQIGIYPNSSFFFEGNDRFALLQGSTEFYVPPGPGMKIQVGDVSIVKFRVQQAGGDPNLPPVKEEATFGSISIQPNGSITVKDVEGRLSVLNRSNAVVAALSPNESVTLSTTSGGKLQVAQTTQTAGGGTTGAAGGGEFLGISTLGWVGVGAAAVVTGVGIGIAAGGAGSKGVCP